MKKCNNCGAMMNEDAKFCTNCGAAFTETESNQNIDTSENSNSDSNENQTSQMVQNVSNAVKSVEYDKVAQGYWKYFLMTLKNPSTSFTVTDKINGWIQFVLIAILNSLVSVSILTIMPTTESGIGLFFKLFFVQFIINVAGIGILFIFKNFVQKVSTPFNVVTSQYGGLLSINIILLLIVFISALISPIAMISIIMVGVVLVGIVNVIAFNMYLLNGKNNSKLDNFYVAVLANAVVLIIIAIITRIGMEMMIDQMLPYMFNQYMY